MKISYQKPDFLYPLQDQIYNCKTRFVFTLSGNKLGKTFSHCLWINEKCLLGPSGAQYAWLGPFFRTSEIAFNLLKKLITDSTLFKLLEEKKYPKQFHFNNSKMRITYPNDSILHFFSGENIDSIYGYEIHAACVDEASRMKEEAYNALLSTLYATNGPVRLISNATIRNNWFYQKWLKIYNLPDRTDGETTAFKLTAHDAIRAGIMPEEVFLSAKKSYIPSIFKRDFLAEVPTEDVNVFKLNKIYDCIIAEPPDNSLNKVWYLGIDLGFTAGQKSDYTVIIGLDKNGQLRFFKRFKAEGEELIHLLKSYIGDKVAYIDNTGGGITIFHLLQKDCPNLEPYTFTNKSKTLAIETLAHYVHSELISYPDIKVLIDELCCYEIDTTKTGKSTYSNGKGGTDHDDSVIALALATLKYKESGDHGEEPTFEVYDLSEEENKGQWHNIGENNNYDFSYNF